MRRTLQPTLAAQVVQLIQDGTSMRAVARRFAVSDNARPHVARVCQQFLQDEGIEAMDWPAHSPDLNPIEHIWDIMSRTINQRHVAPQTLQELEDALVQILGCVAKGSLGPVLKVLNCTEQKIFALKVLPKGEILRRNTLKQCKEEVSIQRQVKHPFIQCLGESWQGQRHLFIMCNYCSYGDLYSLWMSAKHIDEDTIRLFAAELVSVLAYLHDLGIIHRDVKMENILLDERGHLKLSDFGLSRHLAIGERACTICGTLHYMGKERTD
ncbi:unnamed protein product [Ranitomeya imitator]|uniref:Protein kinase domain-containing protein n=1 Tax=Ranitomeya imitator TaxID=111125 RepID=A0ABN9M3U0_9NEOB|nr:unnamed protein product [Ranitomeya imitator]